MRLAQLVNAKRECVAASCFAGFIAAGTCAAAAASYQLIDLTPTTGRPDAQIFSAAGGQQVGINNSQPTVWTGTASSAITLSSGIYSQVAVVSTNGTVQGGYGYVGLEGVTRPLVWIGGVPVELSVNGTAIANGNVSAFSGDRPAGSGLFTDTTGTYAPHALLWNSQGTSFTDLNPGGYTESQVSAATDTYQGGVVKK